MLLCIPLVDFEHTMYYVFACVSIPYYSWCYNRDWWNPFTTMWTISVYADVTIRWGSQFVDDTNANAWWWCWVMMLTQGAALLFHIWAKREQHTVCVSTGTTSATTDGRSRAPCSVAECWKSIFCLAAPRLAHQYIHMMGCWTSNRTIDYMYACIYNTYTRSIATVCWRIRVGLFERRRTRTRAACDFPPLWILYTNVRLCIHINYSRAFKSYELESTGQMFRCCNNRCSQQKKGVRVIQMAYDTQPAHKI